LYDIEGRSVLSGSGTEKTQLQLESLKSGVYMLNVSNNFGFRTIRIVKVN
jgi:hypothetical protein